MKHILHALFTLLLSTSAVQAQTEGTYELSVGPLSMTVDAAHGGKILSLKHGEDEVLSQSRWPESFGSTFWTSPQKEWNWPPVAEFDKQPYTVVAATEGHLHIQSNVAERLQLSVGKQFAVDAADTAIVITYSIKNHATEPRQVAPWEITRVTNTDGSLIFFDADTAAIWPKGLLSFQQAHGIAWYQPDEAPQNRKVNADGKGWLAHLSKGLLMLKVFPDLDASQPAPGEAEIQVYVNQRKTYIELESQGAYTTLQPGGSLSWTVRWYLRQAAATDGKPSAALARQVAALITR